MSSSRGYHRAAEISRVNWGQSTMKDDSRKLARRWPNWLGTGRRTASWAGVLPIVLALPLIDRPLKATAILGTSQTFAVLGGSAVTNIGATIIDGNLGVYPGASITGTGTVTLTGMIHDSDAVAQQAQIDETTAYNTLQGLPFSNNLTGQDLGGMTLTSGVYFFSSSAQLTGTLTLDFQGQSNLMIVFQIGSTLTTASGSKVIVENGTASDGVYFQVGSSATLGSSTVFEGNILALASITFNSTAEILCGRAFAQTGAVTMISNTISDNCSGPGSMGPGTGSEGSGNSDFGSLGFSSGNSAVPEPSTLMTSLIGLFVTLSLMWMRTRKSVRHRSN